MSIVAIELAGESSVYEWEKVDEDENFSRVTLFPERDSDSVGVSTMRCAVASQLDDIAPEAVAIPGWSKPGALAALEWCCQAKVPAVVMSATTAQDSARYWWKEVPKRRLVALFSAAVVAGQAHRSYLSSLGMPAERVFLGYDAVDNEYFREQSSAVQEEAAAWRRRLGLPERYFLACARFVPKKNLIRLIRAFAQYRHQAHAASWELVLLGDGPERATIEHAVAEAGIGSVVHLPGFKQYDDLPKYYGLADAFIHASTTEQWGLVVNEAMASGLPVLVSERCGCAPELVCSGENGYTFDPYDVAAMHRHIERMADGTYDREAMGEASRRIVDRWTPERFAEGLHQAVQVALKHPKPDASIVDRTLMRGLAYR
jgi:glycosyltransferase involved in cell wall biosynthesis